MLKTVKPKKGKVGVGSDSRAGRGGSEIDRSKMDDVEVDGDEVKVDKVEKKGWKTSKSKNLFKSKKMVILNFFIPRAKLAFTELRQVFFKTPIFYHFDPKCHIQIETDISSYAISRVFSQLTLDDLGQWHPVAFFFCKMIPAEIKFKTHDGELLAIIEAFKTWKHYLKGSQHKILMPTNHNNLCRFMDIKSLSSR